MASDDSDDMAGASKDAQSARLTRGTVRLAKLRAKGIMNDVEFNSHGQPMGKTAVEMQNFINNMASNDNDSSAVAFKGTHSTRSSRGNVRLNSLAKRKAKEDMDLAKRKAKEDMDDVEFNTYGQPVGKTAVGVQSCVKNVASNDSDDLPFASKDVQSTKSTRGKTQLNSLSKRRAESIMHDIEFNTYGQPVGKATPEMRSFVKNMASNDSDEALASKDAESIRSTKGNGQLKRLAKRRAEEIIRHDVVFNTYRQPVDKTAAKMQSFVKNNDSDDSAGASKNAQSIRSTRGNVQLSTLTKQKAEEIIRHDVEFNTYRQPVDRTGAEMRSSVKNMDSSDSDDSAGASKDAQSTRSRRGKVQLNSVAKRRAEGVMHDDEFNAYRQPSERTAAEMQSFVKNMASNDSDDSPVASKNAQSTRSTRGKVRLDCVAKRRALGILHDVEFNTHGQPVGKVAAEMQSYIGLLARDHVKINYKTWKQVPKNVKEFIWESVKSSYIVPEKWKSGCLESASVKWRGWKTRLYNDFIVPNKEDPTKLYEPPTDSSILAEDWNEFVKSRTSAEFEKLSEKQKERRSKNLYPHRLSRRGYARLAEDMKNELQDDEEINRAMMWKKARLTKEGDAEDENLKIAVQKIDNYIRDKEEGVFKSKGGFDDLLTCALEKPEHSSCVRGVGAYVSPTTYFKTPREKRQKIDEKSLRELEYAKKTIEEHEKKIEEHDSVLEKYDKTICDLVARIGKLEDAIGEKDKVYEDKGSCFVKALCQEINEHEKGEDDEEVVLVDKSATLQGKSVALMLGSTKTIVGYGTVFAAGNKLHGAPLPKDCLRVSINEVLVGNALLPFCISDEIYTVGSALGSHVAWPTQLVVAKDETPAKKKVAKKVELEKMVKGYASLPSSLKALYCVMEKSFKDGRGLRMPLDVDVFGLDLHVWILREDVIAFCDLEPIAGNCIIAYIWHLYKNLKENETDDRFLFVNPFCISPAPKVSREDRAHLLADRFLNATSNQLVLVPCNVGEHWILTIIEPYKDRIYLMDPLSHRNRDSTWKSVVDTAMSIFNANMGKKSKKASNWIIIKSPMQPDSKQCGYYVMRFMKEIVEGFENDDSISMMSLFQKNEFSQSEIDEVREEWATCVIEHILD